MLKSPDSSSKPADTAGSESHPQSARVVFTPPPLPSRSYNFLDTAKSVKLSVIREVERFTREIAQRRTPALEAGSQVKTLPPSPSAVQDPEVSTETRPSPASPSDTSPPGSKLLSTDAASTPIDSSPSRSSAPGSAYTYEDVKRLLLKLFEESRSAQVSAATRSEPTKFGTESLRITEPTESSTLSES